MVCRAGILPAPFGADFFGGLYPFHLNLQLRYSEMGDHTRRKNIANSSKASIYLTKGKLHLIIRKNFTNV